MRIENIVVAAVAMDEGILERKRVEPAGCAGVPGQFFHAHGETAVRRAFLDDDDMSIGPQNLGQSFAVERLERMDRNNRRAFAGRLKSLGESKGALHDRPVGENADVAALAQPTQLAENPRIGRRF